MDGVGVVFVLIPVMTGIAAAVFIKVGDMLDTWAERRRAANVG